MLENINIKNILFLDIETVPVEYHYSNLDKNWQELWDKKTQFFQNRDGVSAEEIYDRAGIYAEFAKIVCISCGVIDDENNQLRIKSYYHDNEKSLLEDFSQLLNDYYSHPEKLLCAHNGKEFDFPFIARRMIVNGIKLPKIIDVSGAKPWEVRHLDTMHLWRFGDYKHYTSLNLLANLLGIPSPKNDIDGSQVAQIYYEENALPAIVDYCQKDVEALVRVFLRFKGIDLPLKVIKTEHKKNAISV